MNPELVEVLVEQFKALATPVAIVGFMILVGERLIQALEPLVKPGLAWLQRKLSTPEGWLMMLFSWLVVGGIVSATELNIFVLFIPRPWVGRLLTVMVCAGGSNLLHDIWPMPKIKRA